MPFYREEIEKHFYCAKCGKEIKGKTRRERICFEHIILDGDRVVPILGQNFSDRGIYLCPKCVKDFSAFIKNEYPKEQSEREKLLENKLKEVTEEFSKDIQTVNQGLLVLNGLVQEINNNINSSSYGNEKDEKHRYLYSKLEVFRFIEELSGKSEENEETDNE